MTLAQVSIGLANWQILLGDSLRVIDVEEIRVQDRLDDTCNNGDGIVEARNLEKVPVDPVWYVQRSVGAKRKQIVRRNSLCFPSSLQHEELG